MRAVESAARKKSNSPGVRPCTSKSPNVHQFLPFELFLRTIWPHDRAKNYMRLTGTGARTAKYRLSGKRLPDYAEVVAIIRSEHGFEFIQHVMGAAAPKWWKSVRKARGLGDMRRQLADQQRRIAQLEMQLD